MNEKAKVQNSVRWKYKFYKFHSGEASFGQQNWTAGIPLRRTAGGRHSFPSSLLGQVTLTNTYISILISSNVQMDRYFSKSLDPIVMTLLAPGEKFSFLTTVKKENDLCVLIFRKRVSDL